MLKNRWMVKGILLLLPFIALLFIIVSKFLFQEPIKIGFLGPITGKYADLGVYGRNGAFLAVKYINSKGGIKGRQLEIIVEDTYGTVNGSIEAFKKLVSKNVVAIIGPMLSTSTIAVKPLIDKYQIPTISPTASTSVLSGKRDSFFRIMNDNASEARAIALFAIDVLNKTIDHTRKWCIIYDLGNPEYALDLVAHFKRVLKRQSNKDHIGFQLGYIAEGSGVPESVYRALQKLSFDSLLIVTSAIDGAQIVNWISANRPEVMVFGSTWMASEELLKRLRPDHVKIYVLQQFPLRHTPRTKYFFQLYKQQYGHDANFAASTSYEAVILLYEALSISNHLTRQSLLNAITQVKNCAGMFWPLNMDDYGEPHRPCWMSEIIGKSFHPIKNMCYLSRKNSQGPEKW